MNDLPNALWITLIGMGIVFIAIVLLWGLMALIVRLTAEKEPGAAEAPAVVSPEEAGSEPSAADLRRGRAAAASAAVTAALALQGKKRTLLPTRQEYSVSPWQAVGRIGELTRRGSTARKQVSR